MGLSSLRLLPNDHRPKVHSLRRRARSSFLPVHPTFLVLSTPFAHKHTTTRPRSIHHSQNVHATSPSASIACQTSRARTPTPDTVAEHRPADPVSHLHLPEPPLDVLLRNLRICITSAWLLGAPCIQLAASYSSTFDTSAELGGRTGARLCEAQL